MSEFFIRTSDLLKQIESFRKDHLDVLSLDILEPEDDDPSTLVIAGINSSDDSGGVSEEMIDSDDALSELF